MRRSSAGQKLVSFCRELASASPAPGGGAAAALTGALGASLIEMTCRLNDKRLLRTGKNPGPAARLRKLSALRSRFLASMDADARAFAKISSLAKKKQKGAAWQSALKKGATVPSVIADLAIQALRLGASETSRTGRWIKGDLVEGALLLTACVESARLSTEANLAVLADKAFVRRTSARIRSQRREADSLNRVVGKLWFS